MTVKLSPSHLEAWRGFITAHSLIIEQIEQRMQEAGVIPLAWYDVLIELYEAPDRRLRQYELARAVVLSKSNVSRLVDRLEAATLVTRERCETDKRGAYVVLTDAGVAAMRKAWPVYARGIEERYARVLTEDETHTLSHAFARLIAAARAADLSTTDAP